jgi:Outer membrane protein beta-barrel domain
VAAQSREDWQHGTTLSGFFGAGTSSSDTTTAGGVGLAWELTHHFTIEGRGIWLRENGRDDSFAATFGSHMSLTPGRTVSPFVSAGIGMYRTTYSTASTSVPAFYRSRMTVEGPAHNETFQDFSVAFGGGLDVLLSAHFALRPEVNVMLVMANWETRPVTTFGVQLVYHFDSHRIGPQ